MPSRSRRSRFTCRTSTRVKNSAPCLLPQRVVLARSADSVHKATTSDWTRPFVMWKLRGVLMAKTVKAKSSGNGEPSVDNEHELVTMARGLAEIVATHGLSELIVDTKDTTL